MALSPPYCVILRGKESQWASLTFSVPAHGVSERVPAVVFPHAGVRMCLILLRVFFAHSTDHPQPTPLLHGLLPVCLCSLDSELPRTADGSAYFLEEPEGPGQSPAPRRPSVLDERADGARAITA